MGSTIADFYCFHLLISIVILFTDRLKKNDIVRGIGMKILIAEDDAAINKLLGEILSGAGYEPVQAYSGTEAKMIARELKTRYHQHP